MTLLQSESHRTAETAIYNNSNNNTNHNGRNNNNNNYNSSLTLLPLLDWDNVQGKLYDREEQTARLIAAYQRRLSDEGGQEVVLITGESGSGKTELAQQAFRQYVLHDGGYFLSGKCDPLAQDLLHAQPYGAFVSALTDFVHFIVNDDETMIPSVKAAIEATLDSEISVLQRVVPALDRIIGSQTERWKTSIHGVDAESRFSQIVCKFLRAICSDGVLLDRPVVLFMDDIQWANESSIEMLRNLAMDKENTKLLLVCACRSDAVSFDDPLSQMLRHVEDAARVQITEIQLSNIGPAALQDMVSDLLHMPPDDCHDLAAIVYHQTNGNLFFAMQLLRLWNEQGLLQKEVNSNVEQEDGGGAGAGAGAGAGGDIWNWCDKQCLLASQGKSVYQVLDARIKLLPRKMMENLQAASCVGNEISTEVFADWGGSLLMTRQELEVAERGLGLITVNAKSGVIQFSHDKVHQAIYHLIPESQRPAAHLAMGREMWNLLQQRPPEALEKHIFLVSNQLIRGVEMLENQDEKNCVAALLFQAGQKAVSLSAFLAAATYFNAGIGLLGPNHWKDNYDWSLELYNSAAEVEYCIGHLDRVDQLLGEILQHAKHFDDRLRSYNLRIHALGARNELGAAIAEGFDVLVSLGERFPSSVGTSHVAIDFIRTKWILRGKTDEDILNLPGMIHKSALESVRFLTLTLAYVRWKKPEFVPLVAMRIIRLTLRYGLTGMSSVAFATLGVILVSNGKEDEGFRYGSLALSILNKFQARDLECRVHTIVFGMIRPSFHALRDSIKPLLAAHRTGLVTGDIQFSMISAALYSGMITSTGAPLSRITQEIQTFRELCNRYGQDSVTAMLKPLQQMCVNLMGGSANPTILTGSIMNEDIAFQEAESKSTTNVVLLIHFKILLASFVHDHHLVDGLCIKMRKIKRNQLIPCSMDIHRFHEGLMAAALSSRSKRHGKLARRNLEQLTKHAQRAPWNLKNKISLLEAELLTSAGKFEEANIKYEQSIHFACQEMFLHEQALACEKAGLSRLHFSRPVEALAYFERAKVLYRTWDAHMKVDQVTSIIDGLRHEHVSTQLNDPSFLFSPIRTLTT